MEYFLLRKSEPAYNNNVAVAVELRAITETLANAYERLKQLALEASTRKAQLFVFNLSSEIYKFYLEAVLQVQVLERRLFYPFKIETYPDEFYVVNFDKRFVRDNSDEIMKQCSEVKQQIQEAYNSILSGSSISKEQRKILHQQINGITTCFLKLKIRTPS